MYRTIIPTTDSRIAHAAAAMRGRTNRRTLDAADDFARTLRSLGHPRNLAQLRERIRDEASRQDQVARERAQARQLGDDPVRSAVCDRYQDCEIEADPAVVVEWRDRPGAYFCLAVWGGDRAQIEEFLR